MATYETLKAAIDQYIKANGNKEITGTVLNNVLTAMVNELGHYATFAGVATPSTNPGQPDQNVFYIAGQAGTYANFGGIVIPDGITVLTWNGSWASNIILGGDGVFDISAYKATGGTLATFADLSAALDGGNNIPQSLRKGGMSVKFVQSSDNNYVQYRYMGSDVTGTPNPFLNIANWQKSDTNVKRVIDFSIEHSSSIIIRGLSGWGKESNYTSYLVPIDNAESLELNTTSAIQFALLQNNTQTIDQQPNYATGYTQPVQVSSNIRLDVPSDAKFLYLLIVPGSISLPDSAYKYCNINTLDNKIDERTTIRQEGMENNKISLINEYIAGLSPTWTNSNGTYSGCICQIDNACVVKMSSNQNFQFAILKSNNHVDGEPIDYVSGWDRPLQPSESEVEIRIPEDGKFIYFLVAEGLFAIPNIELFFTTNDCCKNGNSLTVDFDKTKTEEGVIADGQWYQGNGFTHKCINVQDFRKAIIRSKVSTPCTYAFLKTNSYVYGSAPEYASGYSAPVILQANSVANLNIPIDAKYLYVYCNHPEEGLLLPLEVDLYIDYVQELNIKENNEFYNKVRNSREQLLSLFTQMGNRCKFPITEQGEYQNTILVSPGTSYVGGLWIRDYYYFSLCNTIPSESIKDAYLWCKSHVDTSGTYAYMVPDKINSNGVREWVGDAPAIDGSIFMVFIACRYFELTNDSDFILNELPFLAELIENVPMLENCVYNSDSPNRVGFGFEDSVHMTGKLAYCTVLLYDACLRLNKICSLFRISTYSFNELSTNIKSSFIETFWDGTYLKAATGLCNGQFDIIAAAYAVSCELVDGNAAISILEAILGYQNDILCHGYCRHLPTQYYYSSQQAWESYNQQQFAGVNYYQSGGYWTIGIPHVYNAILKYKGKDTIKPLLEELIDYTISGKDAKEWFYGGLQGSNPNTQSCGAILCCINIFLGLDWVY